MARLGSDPGTVPLLEGQILRIAGLVTVACSAAVAAASVATPHGLSVPGHPDSSAATAVANVGAPAALVEFALAHPAYPAVALVGFVLVVAGEETPLLGG